MTRNQPKPPETTQNQPKPALPTRNRPKRDLPSLKQAETSHCGPKQVYVIIDHGYYFLSVLQMAAEVIPPQMSKVDGINSIIRIEIRTAINKTSPSNTIHFNEGDPMCCGHPRS